MSRLERLQRLANTQPDDPFLHYGVGLEFTNLEQWPEAIAAFDRALALDARYVAAHVQKARAEIKLSHAAAARAALTAGLAAANAAGDAHAADEMRKMLEALG